MLDSLWGRGLLVAAIAFSAASCSQDGSHSGGGGAATSSGLAKVPVPAGAKPLHVDDNVAMYLSDAPVEATVADCKKLLLADGWQPYGEAGEICFYKRGLTQLTAMITAAPAQGGKTSIQFTQTQMAADLPPAPAAVRMQYGESLKRLDFDSSASTADLFAQYAETLKKAGWEPTTETPIADGNKSFQIFHNPQKDLLTLEVNDVTEVRRGFLKHQTAAEVAEEERRMKEELERRKKEQEAAKP